MYCRFKAFFFLFKLISCYHLEEISQPPTTIRTHVGCWNLPGNLFQSREPDFSTKTTRLIWAQLLYASLHFVFLFFFFLLLKSAVCSGSWSLANYSKWRDVRKSLISSHPDCSSSTLQSLYHLIKNRPTNHETVFLCHILFVWTNTVSVPWFMCKNGGGPYRRDITDVSGQLWQ